MVGTSGGKFPAIREHLKKNIEEVYKNMDTSFKGYPEGDVRDPEAYKAAIAKLPKGSAVISESWIRLFSLPCPHLRPA